jgi:hypothetical protein
MTSHNASLQGRYHYHIPILLTGQILDFSLTITSGCNQARINQKLSELRWLVMLQECLTRATMLGFQHLSLSERLQAKYLIITQMVGISLSALVVSQHNRIAMQRNVSDSRLGLSSSAWFSETLDG